MTDPVVTPISVEPVPTPAQLSRWQELELKAEQDYEKAQAYIAAEKAQYQSEGVVQWAKDNVALVAISAVVLILLVIWVL